MPAPTRIQSVAESARPPGTSPTNADGRRAAGGSADCLVFRDSAFADDVAKSNLTAIFHQHGLENVRSL